MGLSQVGRWEYSSRVGIYNGQPPIFHDLPPGPCFTTRGYVRGFLEDFFKEHAMSHELWEPFGATESFEKPHKIVLLI